MFLLQLPLFVPVNLSVTLSVSFYIFLSVSGDQVQKKFTVLTLSLFFFMHSNNITPGGSQAISSQHFSIHGLI